MSDLPGGRRRTPNSTRLPHTRAELGTPVVDEFPVSKVFAFGSATSPIGSETRCGWTGALSPMPDTTEYLLASPENTRRLYATIGRLKAGEGESTVCPN